MTTMNSNHVARKSLASQIDRLDLLLDGLGEGLNEAVAAAVKNVVAEVVREAVTMTIKEVLGNKDLLRAALAQVEAEEEHLPVQQPTLQEKVRKTWTGVSHLVSEQASKVKSRLAGIWSWTGKLLRTLTTRLSERCQEARLWVGKLAALLWMIRGTCGIALGVGLLVGLGSYLAGPTIAALLAGLSSTGLAMLGRPLVQLWQLLMPAEVRGN